MKLKQVWSSTKYSNRNKIRLFNSLVKSVLLYGCETWKMNESDNKKLDTFQFKCLQRILKIRWPYIVSNDDIFSRTKVKRISTEVKIRRWRWFGPCTQNGEQLSLPDSNGMGTRRHNESGPPKNNMEAYNRERKKTVKMRVLEPSQI